MKKQVLSYWLKDSQKKTYPRLESNINVDVLIVGGGITGLLCAYQLAKLDKYRIALVEKNQLYHSTTGYTTGKATLQHDDIYHQLLKNKGETIARAYYLANSEAVLGLKKIATEENIDCDWVDTKAVLYAFNQEELKRLQKEQSAYDTLGIPYEWLDKDNIPFPTLGGLAIPNQGVFHVVKFLDGIVSKLNIDIYEKTKIIKTKPSEKGAVAETVDHYKIHAKHIIIATHYPIYKRFNFYFMKIKPVCSYIAIANEFAIPSDNAYINLIEPILSIRFLDSAMPKLMVAGFGHDVKNYYSYREQIHRLKTMATGKLQAKDFFEEWYNQDYETMDMIPLIGKAADGPLYIATGYRKWGISSSFVASQIIKDQIQGVNNQYAYLFDPCRSKNAFKTICYNFAMFSTVIKTKLLTVPKSIKIKPGTGRIIQHKMRKIGIYIDQNGKTYSEKPICTHLGCTLRFNNVTKTYECPCHGSRFNYDGTCLDGPAVRNLTKL